MRVVLNDPKRANHEGTMTVTMNESNARVSRGYLAELRMSKANLTHLIYSMEHDRSLNAEHSKIVSLKHMLESIDQQLTVPSRNYLH